MTDCAEPAKAQYKKSKSSRIPQPCYVESLREEEVLLRMTVLKMGSS